MSACGRPWATDSPTSASQLPWHAVLGVQNCLSAQVIAFFSARSSPPSLQSCFLPTLSKRNSSFSGLWAARHWPGFSLVRECHRGNSFGRKHYFSWGPDSLLSAERSLGSWCVYACAHRCMCGGVCVCVWVCTGVCVHGYVCAWECVCMCICVCNITRISRFGDPGVTSGIKRTHFWHLAAQKHKVSAPLRSQRNKAAREQGGEPTFLSCLPARPPPAHCPAYRMETFRGKEFCTAVWETTQIPCICQRPVGELISPGGCRLSLWGPLQSTSGGAAEEGGSGPRWGETFLTSEGSRETCEGAHRGLAVQKSLCPWRLKGGIDQTYNGF